MLGQWLLNTAGEAIGPLLDWVEAAEVFDGPQQWHCLSESSRTIALDSGHRAWVFPLN